MIARLTTTLLATALLAMSACSQLIGLEALDDESQVDAAPPAPMTITLELEDSQDDARQNIEGEIKRSLVPLEVGVEFLVAVRFVDSPVPRGATITDAYLQFTAHAGDQDEALQVEIRAEDSDDSAFFDKAVPLSSRDMTDASVIWDIPPWLVERERDTAQRTGDLSGLIQEVIDRDNWEPGNSLGFFFLRIDGQSPTARRDAIPYDSSPALAAKLTVNWSIDGAP